MENYIEDIKDLLFEYAPSVVTALVILIVGLFAIKFIVN